MRGITVLLIAVFMSGCQLAGPDDPRTDEVHEQREIWSDFQDGTYSFTINRGCFCINGGLHFVQVIDGVVDHAFRIWDNQPVEPDHLQYFETIEELFDMIERAESEADEMSVEYSDHGYPSLISIDWIEQAVDDEIHFEITGVLPGIQVID